MIARLPLQEDLHCTGILPARKVVCCISAQFTTSVLCKIVCILTTKAERTGCS